MKHVWMDRLGSIASATCALHCLVLSFAPVLVSMLGLGLLASDAFEWGFFTLAVSFAVAMAVLGHRAHGTWWVVVGFVSGILVLVAGRLGEATGLFEGGALLTVLGGGLLVASHLANAWHTQARRTVGR